MRHNHAFKVPLILLDEYLDGFVAGADPDLGLVVVDVDEGADSADEVQVFLALDRTDRDQRLLRGDVLFDVVVHLVLVVRVLKKLLVLFN